MNPFDEKPINQEDALMDWAAMIPTPYVKQTVNPYTKLRILLMNGVETESSHFKQMFLRFCTDSDIRKNLALTCRVEQQQQKRIAWLKPIEETLLETAIGYEHLEVDLSAVLAQNEPEHTLLDALDFALIEDFDHLYRFANLLDLDSQIPAQQLVKNYVDITPGRPTIAEHRHPFDSLRSPVYFQNADIRTKLNALIILCAQRQVMDFYANAGNMYHTDLGRRLFAEIAMVEDQHVWHYGSLLDPGTTWLENLLLHEYMECYLYDSFAQDETDAGIKAIWQAHLTHEIAHLHLAAGLLQRFENKQWQQVIRAGALPEPLRFRDTRDRVRSVLSSQVGLTADKNAYKNVKELPADHDFFRFQSRMNRDLNSVPSHVVIVNHQAQFNADYRGESLPNPVPALLNRSVDNTDIARTQ